MICVECGREAPGLVRGACPACFAAKHRLIVLAEALDVEVCAHCGARHVGAHWVEAEEGTPLSWIREEAVEAAVRVHADVHAPELDIQEHAEDEKHFRTTVRLTGTVEGVEVSDEAATTVRVRRGVCDRCSRIHGGYYSAIVQLRATSRDVSPPELQAAHRLVDQELERQRQAGNRMAFLAKHEPHHGGHDYYLGDIDAARHVARLLKDRLGAQVNEAAKLVGRREGEDVHRVTFLVRIRLFAPGDFAQSGERVVQVQSIDRGTAVVVDLATHRRTKVPEDSLRRLGGREVVQEAVLVSQQAADLQVMDPVDHRTLDVPRPTGFAATTSTVEVLRHEEHLYLVPPATRPTNNP